MRLALSRAGLSPERCASWPRVCAHHTHVVRASACVRAVRCLGHHSKHDHPVVFLCSRCCCATTTTATTATTTTDPALFQACRWLGRCITAHSFSHGLTRLVCAPGFPRCARLLRVAGGGGSRERQGETLKAAEGVGGSRQRDTRSHWHPPSQGTSARGVLRAAPHMTDPPPARFSFFSQRKARAGDAPLRALSLFRERRRRGHTSTCKPNTTLPSLT